MTTSLYFVDAGESTDDGIPRMAGRDFDVDVVKVDSSAFQDCKFVNSDIAYFAEGTVSFDSCQFHSCKWILGGAANDTLNYLKLIYGGLGEDGRKIVEDFFESIRIGR